MPGGFRACSRTPAVLKSAVPAEAAIAAIRDVTVEQTTEKYFSVDFYDALNLAFDQFTLPLLSQRQPQCQGLGALTVRKTRQSSRPIHGESVEG